MKTIDLFREGLNQSLSIEGFLLTMFESSNELCESVSQEVRDHFKELVFSTVIQKDPELSESLSFGKPIPFYNVRSIGAENYIELAKEFLEKTMTVAAV